MNKSCARLGSTLFNLTSSIVPKRSYLVVHATCGNNVKYYRAALLLQSGNKKMQPLAINQNLYTKIYY